ncbi:GlsB/YeaQ/YmgE family stress response membrane protein [Aquisediminimonas profunda]|uniref:GlsB/YeaQ/YmgE family stress response membrane protein n=1 Tax=Aquisediminimonas profunda TaxID=1550733 RepID=UPI001C6279BC|nr:GlsB/YeaQ/YmgE family stress response membrane protein [Aquisediminimonas profunda]
MGGIIGWIIFGAIAGALGKLVMPGKDPGGFVITTLLGIAGSVGANYAAPIVGLSAEGSTIKELAYAIVGVVILLALYRMLKGRAT